VSVIKRSVFVLTSAPEEDYLSVHVHCDDDFTTEFAASVGCDFGESKGAKRPEGSAVVSVEHKAANLGIDPTIRKILPPVFIDGPFGTGTNDIFKFDVAVLVGANDKVTPFASILKSIWYRLNYPQRTARLSKVYFFWICPDFVAFEWFKSLLLAIEAQDMDSQIEMHTVSASITTGRLTNSVQYLTTSSQTMDALDHNALSGDTTLEDGFTGFRVPTKFGQPDWARIFTSICRIHAPGEVGVFCSSPKDLEESVHEQCKTYSNRNLKVSWRGHDF